MDEMNGDGVTSQCAVGQPLSTCTDDGHTCIISAPPVPLEVRRALALHDKKKMLMQRLTVLQERGRISKKRCAEIMKEVDNMTGTTEEKLEQLGSTWTRFAPRSQKGGSSSRESSCTPGPYPTSVPTESSSSSPRNTTKTNQKEREPSPNVSTKEKFGRVLTSSEQDVSTRTEGEQDNEEKSILVHSAPMTMRRFGALASVVKATQFLQARTKKELLQKPPICERRAALAKAAVVIQRFWRGFRTRRWFLKSWAQLVIAQNERRAKMKGLLEERRGRLKCTRDARANGLFEVMGTRPTSALCYNQRQRTVLPMAGAKATKLTMASLHRSVAIHSEAEPAVHHNAEGSMVKNWLAEATAIRGSVSTEKADHQKPQIYLASGGALEPSMLVDPRLLQKVKQRRSDQRPTSACCRATRLQVL